MNYRLALAEVFGNSSVDLLNRFAALDWDDSFEALYRYYPKRLSVDYDTASSISATMVSAFTAEGGKRIIFHREWTIPTRVTAMDNPRARRYDDHM